MKAAAIVTACNEEKTISSVLSELRRLPLQDIIVVLNGCTDRTYEKAIEHPGVTVVHIPERLGYDVGRSIGARLTTADIVLFTDADIPLRAEELAPFLLAVQRGMDVALNHLTPLIPVFEQQDQVTRCKAFLNRMLERADLGADSMTAIPHALSRRCLDALGTDVLAVPPLAQARAIIQGMRTAGVCTVNVLARNRRRASMNRGTGNPVEQLIIGDHAEALSAILNASEWNARGESSICTLPSRAKIAEGRNRYTPHKHYHSHV